MLRLRNRAARNPGGLHEQYHDRYVDTRALHGVEAGLREEYPDLDKRFAKLDRQGRFIRLWRKRPRPIRNRNKWVLGLLAIVLLITININKASLGDAWDNNVKSVHETITDNWNKTPWGNHDVPDKAGGNK